MSGRMDNIIHQAYRVPDIFEGNNLVLREKNDPKQPGALCKIRLNIKDIAAFAVYKFDQIVPVGSNECESYAPFLQPGRVLCMCDYIIFFRMKLTPEKLYAWVVNLKSGVDSNNLQQLRAGHRLCEFLLGKLDDDLKIQDKPEVLVCGHINYLLFSLPKTKGSQQKSNTNALSAKKLPVENELGKTPDKFLRVTKSAYDLRALAHTE
jgi:hypothetical protein